mmetsp:Transcript_17789/g.26439  ORF Transcript_17789/g.26439 Transcript_17789/m.26439 type:complete len:484 (+) Transcript_17789:238-1689(+)
MMSDEYSLLEDMIHERDSHIANLTNQLHQTSDSIHTLSKELHQKSVARKQQREEHSHSIKRLKEEHLEQRQKLARFEQNVKGGGGLRVHEYAALMRSANSNQVESSYVIRLQAQLCRAMHSLGVMESQLALVKENCSSLIRFMKEDLSHMVDDRTRREIELMNGLAKVDHEHRVLQDKMESKINEKEELLESVREEYEELGLVYDEEEVKAALEVKYLLEQMEKIETEKERVEKELLQALLDRERQIVALKNETEDLGVRLETLQSNETSDGGKSDGVEGTQQKQAGDGEEQEEAMGAVEDVAQDDNEVQEEADSTVEEETGESEVTNDQQEAIASVTSQLEDTTIEEKTDSTQKESAENGPDSIEKDNADSDPATVEDEGVASDEGENDNGILSSQIQQEENNDEGSNNAEEVDASPDTMSQHEEADEEVVAETDESTYVHVPTDENADDEHETETEPLSTDESKSKPQSDDDAEKDDKINS